MASALIVCIPIFDDDGWPAPPSRQFDDLGGAGTEGDVLVTMAFWCKCVNRLEGKTSKPIYLYFSCSS